jgi:SAM-dependent methyltransferase
LNPGEYALMRAVEDRHWWYRGLRALVWDTWAKLPRGASLPLLDIGCGTGGTLAGAPCAAAGVDRSIEALGFCRARGQRALALAEAASLPFRDGTFSGALLLDVIYHRAVADPAAVLREARRVIAPGGHVIVNVPAYEWLRSTHDAAIHTQRRFTRTELKAMLEGAGFTLVRITYWNTLLFPAAALVRLARRRSARVGSDLADYRKGAGSAIAGAVLGLERSCLRAMDFRFGLSIFAVGRK